MTAAPLSPARLADIAKLRDAAIGYHKQAMADLLNEVSRLQSVVDRLANNERDLAETQLVLEQQDLDLERLRSAANLARSGAAEAVHDYDMMENRISALESGLREACDLIEELVDVEEHEVPLYRLRALADGVQSGKETE
jgi:uncharacterized membrane-anchored protein